MRSRLAPLLALVVVGAVLCVPRLSGASDSALKAYSVELVAERPEGRVSLRAEVLAGSFADARASAHQAASALGPGAVLAFPEETGVSAAWLPWSWRWAEPEIPVPVAYNPTGAPTGVSPAAVIAGLQTWSSVTTSSFHFRYAGVTDNTASILDFGPDGENVISWAFLPCDRGCVLGVTSKEQGHEVDMLLNSNPDAALQLGVGATLDWRTVILHELGHVAGLEHSCPVPFGPCTQAESEAVMYYQYLGVLRKLAPDDVAGLSALYPLVTASPSPAPGPGASPTPTPFPELTVIIERGWNLVVMPPGPITTATASLPCVEALYSYESEAWVAWIRGLGLQLQGITELRDGRAYWAWSSGTCAHVFP